MVELQAQRADLDLSTLYRVRAPKDPLQEPHSSMANISSVAQMDQFRETTPSSYNWKFLRI